MKKDKKFVWLFILFSFIPLCLLMTMIWFVDPFKLWHESFLCQNQIYEARNMRYNAKWMIDKREFNSLIFGSSNMVNISSKEAAAKFGGKFINISILGSNFKERSYILDYIFARTEPKIIISSLDKYVLTDFVSLDKRAKSWTFLYDENKKNDLMVYLNTKFLSYIIKESLKYIFAKKPQCFYANLDRAATSINSTDGTVSAQEIQNQIIKAKKIENIDIDKIKAHIEKYLLKYPKEHENTDFILIIPPYSLIYNAISAQIKNETQAQKIIIKYILEAKLKNLKIYAFDNMDFTKKLENYGDLAHYKKEIDSLILDMISKNIGLLTLENFDAYWQAYEQEAKNFDFIKFTAEFYKIQ